MSKDDSAVVTVLKFIIEGQAQGDIKEFLVNAGLSDEDSLKAIESAFEELEGTLDLSPETRRAWCLEALRELYRRLIETGDYTGAIRAVVEISKLSKKMPASSAKEKEEIKENKDEALELLQSKKILTIPRK